MSTPIKVLTVPPDEGIAYPDLVRLLRRATLRLRNADIAFPSGTWTPTDASGAGLSLTLDQQAVYVQHGDLVTATFAVTYPVTASGANAEIGGLPGTVLPNHNAAFGGMIGYTDAGIAMTLAVAETTNTIEPYTVAGVQVLNSALSGKILRATVVYRVTV